MNYDREVPAKYDTDLFMKSLVSTYAIEGKGADGKNGHFFMTKDITKAACNEVVESHLGFKGAKKDTFIGERFDKLWAHYDILKDGYIEVERAAPLIRSLIGEVESQIGL